MVPIAKAALVTLLLGCGATGTFALANGGFGIGTATENSNEQGSDVPPASPEVTNTAGGNTQETVSGPAAGDQGQVKQEGSREPNVGDVDTREGKDIAEEATDQPQNQGNVPASEGGDGHQDTEVAADGRRAGNAVVQQQENEGQRGQETTGGKQPQSPTQESVVQTSEDDAEVANKGSDGSLQVGDASLPEGQSPQVSGKEDEVNGNAQSSVNTASEPGAKTDQTVTSSSEPNQVASKPEGDTEQTNALDSEKHSDPQSGTENTGVRSDSDTAISSDVQA